VRDEGHFFRFVLFAVFATAVVLPLAENSVYAPGAHRPARWRPSPPLNSSRTPLRRKPPTAAPQPPQGGVTIAVEVPIVTLEVVATTQHGDILTGLKKENFRVLDEGVPQTITNFGADRCSHHHGGSNGIQQTWPMDGLRPTQNIGPTPFFPNLKPQDWVALVTFDMNHRLDVDFTQNKDEVRSAIYHLYFPGFRESNIFDALLDTVDRFKGRQRQEIDPGACQRHRYVFRKHTLDQTMKQLRQSDVTIFCVGVAKPLMNRIEARGWQTAQA